jgi:hypothetical protein
MRPPGFLRSVGLTEQLSPGSIAWRHARLNAASPATAFLGVEELTSALSVERTDRLLSVVRTRHGAASRCRLASPYVLSREVRKDIAERLGGRPEEGGP